MSRIQLNRTRRCRSIRLTLRMLMLHDYILEFFNWQKMNHQTKQIPLILHTPVQTYKSSFKLFQGQLCHSFRFSRAHTNKTTVLACLLPDTHTHEATTSVFVFACFLHSLKKLQFAPHLLMGAYSSIKVSAHHKA